MDSEQEWLLLVEEKFLQQEEQKEEKVCQHKTADLWSFSSIITHCDRIFVTIQS